MHRIACGFAGLAGGCVMSAAMAQVPTSPSTAAAPPPNAMPSASAAAPALPANRWTADQIQAAFRQADMNGDGVLTRAEAQRLPIMPISFEDADTNKDGLLDIDEYLNAFQAQPGPLRQR